MSSLGREIEAFLNTHDQGRIIVGEFDKVRDEIVEKYGVGDFDELPVEGVAEFEQRMSELGAHVLTVNVGEEDD